MKKKVLDVNNVKDKVRQSDHLYSDLFGQSGTSHKTPKTPARGPSKASAHKATGQKASMSRTSTGFNRKEAKFSNLRSALDNHDYEA
jgi:hypothetical protein